MYLKIKTTVLLLLMFTSISFGQQLMMHDIAGEKSEVKLRYLHGYFKALDFSELSGIYEISGRYRFTPKLAVSLTVPFTYFSIDQTFRGYMQDISRVQQESKDIGNVAAEANIKMHSSENTNRQMNLGISFPTAQADNKSSMLVLGYLVNPLDYERYVPELASFSALISSISTYRVSLLINYDAGIKYVLSTNKAHIRDDEFFFRYGIGAGYNFGQLTVKTEMTGLLNFSGTYKEFSDRVMNTFCAGAEWRGFVFKPTLFFQYRTNEFFQVYAKTVSGIKISYEF